MFDNKLWVRMEMRDPVDGRSHWVWVAIASLTGIDDLKEMVTHACV